MTFSSKPSLKQYNPKNPLSGLAFGTG